MKIKIKLTDEASLPKNANPTDAGYDLTATSFKIVGEKLEKGFSDGKDAYASIDYIEYDTGIVIAPRDRADYALVFPRSSISKYNLVLANSVGVIDNSYRGTIKLRFKYLYQPSDICFVVNDQGSSRTAITVNEGKIYKVGDKIGQLVAATKQEINWVPLENLDETSRGSGGFGSTGS